MTRRNKILATIAVMLLFAILPVTVTPSSATPPTPPTLLAGIDASGVVIPKDSGVIIENQTITFDIPEFPILDEGHRLDGDIPGNVKTDYTLYNPTDQEITFKIAYPFAQDSTYYGYFDTIEREKYSIYIDGVAQEGSLRHGLNFNDNYFYEGFDSIIYDEYISNEYCSPDMAVTKYTFKQSGVEINSAYIGFDVKETEYVGSCIYLGENSHAYTYYGKQLRFARQAVKDNGSFDVYVFGEELTHLPTWKIYEDINVQDGEEVSGKIDFVGKETTTFLEFIRGCYNEELGISEIDWFNIAATEMSRLMEYERKQTLFESLNGMLDFYIISGLVCEMTIAPGERSVLTLNAPVYPSIETAYNPYTYYYSYTLSPSNAELFDGKIDVNIITPYHLLFNNSNGYVKTEDGYSLTFVSIKDFSENLSAIAGGFDFTLCEVENPEKVDQTNWGLGLIMIFVFIMYGLLQVQEFIGDIFTNVREWISGLFSF